MAVAWAELQWAPAPEACSGKVLRGKDARMSCRRRGFAMIIAGLPPLVLASWLPGCALPERGCEYPLPGLDRPA